MIYILYGNVISVPTSQEIQMSVNDRIWVGVQKTSTPQWCAIYWLTYMFMQLCGKSTIQHMYLTF